MKTSILIFILLLTSGSVIWTGCKQADWLDEKRLKSQVTPETIKDFQAILDNIAWINARFTNTGIAASNNVYVQDKDFASIIQREQQIYMWGMHPWDNSNGSSAEWDNTYSIIEYANIVLDGLKERNLSGTEVDNIKGQAYFYRAIALYNLAILFCKQFDATTAEGEKGLPIRLSSDVNIIEQRSNLKKTYDQIIADIKSSISVLNEKQSVITRPGKSAAYALLSKVLLNTGDYAGALDNADQVLKRHNGIIDFNSDKVSLNQPYRFPLNGINNEEVIFFAYSAMNVIVRPTTTTRGNVDTSLMKLYSENDLRKEYFFAKSGTNYKFRGNYTGNFNTFCGLATNEIYLIKAECMARSSKSSEAMKVLNQLLKRRYRTGTFVDLIATTPQQALTIILQERRKELPFTGNIPWEDIKRLNLDPSREITLTRTLNNEQYSLKPNDPRYALPIPEFEIRISGIEQNSY